MGKKEKLIGRFKTLPKDFTYDELKTMLTYLGFEEGQSGKTGGSRVRFVNKNNLIIVLHKPHPSNIIKEYKMKQVYQILKEEKLI